MTITHREGREVAIGVVGHRELPEPTRIEQCVTDVLERIGRAHDDRPLAVLSALAEGTDRLVAWLAMREFGARLVAVLPLPRTEYARDFATGESLDAFHELLAEAEEILELPFRWNREEAYEVAGRLIVGRSDVLVAVWDGRPAKGPGGTGAMVGLARERAVPLAWVHAGKPVAVETGASGSAASPSSIGAGEPDTCADADAGVPPKVEEVRIGAVRFEGFPG